MRGKKNKEIRKKNALSPDVSPTINLPQGLKLSSAQVIHQEGPLPPAAMLKEYDEAYPGCAEIIINMAVDEQKHRHRQEQSLNENIRIENEYIHKNNRFVLWFSVFVYSTITSVGVVMALLDMPYLAGICFGTPLFGELAKLLHRKKDNPHQRFE